MYLIDTDVISELRKKEKANAGVVTFFRNAASNGTALYLSAVSMGELRRGVESIRYRGDAAILPARPRATPSVRHTPA